MGASHVQEPGGKKLRPLRSPRLQPAPAVWNHPSCGFPSVCKRCVMSESLGTLLLANPTTPHQCYQ